MDLIWLIALVGIVVFVMCFIAVMLSFINISTDDTAAGLGDGPVVPIGAAARRPSERDGPSRGAAGL